MADTRAHLRSIPFPVVADMLGIDMTRFKRRKDDWQGACPIHEAKSNNNAFGYHDSGKFGCFSCGAKGSGALDLVMKVKDCNLTAATALLEPLVGKIPEMKKEPVAASESVLKPYVGSYPKFFVENEWLTNRVPDSDVRKRYGIGYYSNPSRQSKYNNRVFIPIKDLEGTQYGWLVRNPEPKEGESKYTWPTGLPKTPFLFGAHELGTSSQLPLRLVYLVESPFAVLRFAMYGLPAVSPFGWSVSDDQVTLLRQLAKGIVYLPDRNKSEQSASIANTIARHVWCRFPALPDGIDDPEHLPNREAVLALHS